MEKICMSQKRIDEIRAICKEHGNDPGELINILHTVQGKLGYLPKEVQELIAMELGIPAAKVYGVVTFYSFFTMKPKGKYPISVCMGTACYVKGSQQILDKISEVLGIGPGECTADGNFSLEACRCIGACGLAPVLTVNDEVYGKITEDDVPGILAKYQA